MGSKNKDKTVFFSEDSSHFYKIEDDHLCISILFVQFPIVSVNLYQENKKIKYILNRCIVLKTVDYRLSKIMFTCY